MRDDLIGQDHGFLGFNVFKRRSDPDFLLAVPLVSPLPVVLASGWTFSHKIEMRGSLPANFDLAMAQDAIRRDGYYVFDGGRARQSA
ncbi:MAG: hypothetical protein ACK4K8_16870 [Pannonibacter sp.]